MEHTENPPYWFWHQGIVNNNIDSSVNMVDSPCVPSRPPFFIGVILRLMFVAGGTLPHATVYNFLKVGNAPLSS